MTSRSIFVVGGLMCICFGITLMLFQKKENVVMKDISMGVGNEEAASVNLLDKGIVEDNTIEKQNDED